MESAIAPTPDEEPATPAQTRADLLGGQDRRGAPIWAAFLQERGGRRRAGPLSHFVRERRLFALQLYLLLHCLARAKPWDAYLPAAAWARALDRTGPGAEGTVSRSWQWLRENRLVRAERERRLLRVFLLKEDGSGKRFSRGSDYFTLPLAYFRDEWYAKLDLPATAVLLIALNLSRSRTWFELRTERAAEWFGISADTLQRGLDELREKKLLEVHARRVRDARARYGVTTVNEYRLLPPFDVPRVQTKSKKRRRRRRK